MKPAAALEALRRFGLDADAAALEPLGGGHVNESAVARFADGRHYTLQKLNPAACADWHGLMEGVVRVTRHLAAGGAATLSFLACAQGPLWEDGEGSLWRCYRYHDGCSVRSRATEAQAEAFGRALGALHTRLASLDPGTVPDLYGGFHGLAKHGAALARAASGACGAEAGFAGRVLAALGRERTREAARGPLPLRVLHGDPKLHNLLFSDETDEPVCFLDFDNMGPGLLPDDFGDAARSVCSPDGSSFSAALFSRFCRGYLPAARFLTEAERAALPAAPRRMALELSARYLADALSGGSYFGALTPAGKRASAAARFALYEDLLRQQSAVDEALAF